MIVLLVSAAVGTTRLHKGPGKNGNVKILTGHTLSTTDKEGKKRPRSDGDDDSPRVVDFNYYLKKDLLIWDDLERDDVKITKCQFVKGSRVAMLTFQGENLDQSDFEKGAVFSIEQAALEIMCMENIPPYTHIDPQDAFLYFVIKGFKQSDDGSLTARVKIIHGRHVIPIIDISVHNDAASDEEVEALKDNVVYDNDSGEVDEADAERMMMTVSRWNDPQKKNDTLISLPTADRFSLYEKTISIGPYELKANVDVNVGVSSFRLKHLWTLKFEWEQTLEGSFSARLYFHRDSSSEKRVGEIARWFIPGISFSIGIPLVGKLQAGAFVGVNWVTEISGSSSMSLYFNAKYTKKERVTAQLIPPRYDAQNLPGSGPSAELSVTGGTSYSYTLSGFYGVRPLIGAGITHTKRKISFRRWRIRITTVKKSIDGNIGADIGIQLSATLQSPPFQPYTGSDLKLGQCDKCHALQGSAYFKGKGLTVQTVVGGRVTNEKTLVSTLFNIRLGTLCVLEQMCPLRRQISD